MISQAHSFQWLGSFGNKGNGRYRQELRQGLSAITHYLTAHQLSQERTLLRLDGQYGTGTVLGSLASFAFVTRRKEYSILSDAYWIRVKLMRSSPAPAAMASRQLPSPLKQAASRGRTSHFSLMARSDVPPTNGSLPMNDAEKLMAACASCMEPVSAVAVPVPCAGSVNGMGVRRQSRAR